MSLPEHIQQFQTHILDRYAQHQRDLPWRQTTDGYKILVSEIMLQQTQVDRVIPKWNKFLDTLPTFYDLANADNITLLQLRSGLGYNRRAIYLQKTAQAVMNNHRGILPSNLDTLKSLPGIGPYTAAALCAFVYNLDIPVVDINIKRVLIHHFNLDEHITDKALTDFAQKIIPSGRSRDWHNALMDYGSLVYTSKKTGIKSPKQSKFVGSPRRVRGNVMKTLLEQGTATIADLKKYFPHDQFNKIIQKMINEGLIMEKQEVLCIKK